MRWSAHARFGRLVERLAPIADANDRIKDMGGSTWLEKKLTATGAGSCYDIERGLYLGEVDGELRSSEWEAAPGQVTGLTYTEAYDNSTDEPGYDRSFPNYQFRVRTRNEAGWGRWPTPVTFLIDIGPPGGKVIFLSP